MTSILQKSTKEKNKRLQWQSSEISRRYHKLLKIQTSRLGVISLNTLPKATFKNYCLISGKSRSVYSRPFRLSRHQIKKHFNQICGLKVSSW